MIFVGLCTESCIAQSCAYAVPPFRKEMDECSNKIHVLDLSWSVCLNWTVAHLNPGRCKLVIHKWSWTRHIQSERPPHILQIFTSGSCSGSQVTAMFGHISVFHTSQSGSYIWSYACTWSVSSWGSGLEQSGKFKMANRTKSKICTQPLVHYRPLCCIVSTITDQALSDYSCAAYQAYLYRTRKTAFCVMNCQNTRESYTSPN